MKISPQERAAAEEVMRGCWASWCAQRPGRPLTPADWRRLAEVVAHALRAADNPADVREELTQAVGSARHLPTLLAYRARRIISRGHRRNVVPKVRPETLAARQRAAQAAQAGRQATHRAAAALAALRAGLADVAAGQARSAAEHAPAPLVTGWATEPEHADAPPPVNAEETARRRRHALALARARRQKISSGEERGGR